MSLCTFRFRVLKSLVATFLALYFRSIYIVCTWFIPFMFTISVDYRLAKGVLIEFFKELTLPVTLCFGFILFTIILSNACVIHLDVYYEHRDAPEGHYDGMRPFERLNETILMIWRFFIYWGSVEVVHTYEYKINRDTNNADHVHLITEFAEMLGLELVCYLVWIAYVDDWINHLSFEPPEVEHTP